MVEHLLAPINKALGGIPSTEKTKENTGLIESFNYDDYDDVTSYKSTVVALSCMYD